ncbi:major capsid protein, partial [Staphylococcus aureus]
GSGTEDLFKTFFAPASKFEHVNTPGEESYAFEYVDPKGEFLEINSETNFINVLMYPQLVVKGKAA